MRFILKINNRIYEHFTLKFRRKVGVESQTFEAWMQIAGATLPQKGDTITVTKEIFGVKILKFQAKVNSANYLPASDQKQSFYVVGYDMLRKINYAESATIGFSSPTKCSGNFATQIAPTSKTDLTSGTIETDDAAPDSVSFGKSIIGGDSLLMRDTCFEILELLADKDMYVTKAGAANFRSSPGTDRTVAGPNLMVLIHGINGTIDGDLGYMEDDTRIVKKVRVKGKGAGIKDAYFGEAVAGGATSDDKVRQIELPFLISPQTVNTAAANLLAELNKTVKYAKFRMTPDPFKVDYDIFDTVKLVARLPNKIVNENLRIFSIETEISVSKETHEIVTLELCNFRRGYSSALIMPTKAGEANDHLSYLSTVSTQAQDHVGASGGSSVIAASSSISGNRQEIDSLVFASVAGFPMPAQNVAGVHFFFSVKIVPHFKGSELLFVRLTDGTNFYPNSDGVVVAYSDEVGIPTYQIVHIFIPANVNAVNLTLQASLAGTVAKITADFWNSYYTIGEHTH